MDFNDSAEEAAFREEARSWLAENVIPHAEIAHLELDEQHHIWRERMHKGGWTCISWPKEYGGRGATPMQRIIWDQEYSKYPHLKNYRFDVAEQMVGPTLMKYYKDRPADLERLLPPIASGEEVWVQLFSEPAGGSDLAALRTRAERDGDEWVVNGQKIWSSHAVGGKWGFLVARSDPTVVKHKGITCFYVDLNSPGMEIRPIKQINGDSEFNEVFMTDVRIPDSQRIGEVGQGWAAALDVVSHERLNMGTDTFGIDYEGLCELAKNIEIDGKPAIENAHVRAKLADFYCMEAGLHATTMRAVSALSQGKDLGPETSIGNMIVGARTQEIIAFAMDLMEQSSVVWDQSIKENRFFQDAYMFLPAMRLAGGTDEVQANIVAESVLGLPREHRADKGVPFNELPVGK